MSHATPLSSVPVRDDVTAPAMPADSFRARAQRLIAIVRRIIGVPDYQVYVSHMQRHHPTCTPMDERTFERERLADKYSRPGSRCC